MEQIITSQGEFNFKGAEYAVKLPVFEGPLDLLLHLIKKSEVDIYDIPIAMITEQYLNHLDLMRRLDIDIAGEFLVMASTLTYIKSKMLLPVHVECEEEEEDPREALVRQLLEYQKFKAAAEELQTLAHDRQQVFIHPPAPREDGGEEKNLALPGIGIYNLWRAFQAALQKAPKETPYQVHKRQNKTLEEEIEHILAKLQEFKRITLESLFEDFTLKIELVILFVAVLELTRRQLVKIYQSEPCGKLWISSNGETSAEPAFVSA